VPLLLFSPSSSSSPAGGPYAYAALSTNQTFLDLQNFVLRNLDEVTDTGTTRDLVKDTLNLMHKQRCTEFLWPFMLWGRTETITTVAGQRAYSLHQEFERPLFVRNQTRNALMREMPSANIDAEALTDLSEGPAYTFSLWGVQPVSAQPVSATALRIASSDEDDTGVTKQVTIRGVLEDGDVVTETLTADGTNYVTTDESTYVELISVSKTAPWEGRMVLEEADSTVLLRLRANETGRSYRQIHLLEIPRSVETLKYRFYRKPVWMVNDNDTPDLPAPHGLILVWDALVHMASYNKIGNAERINIWREQRERAEEALYTSYKDAQTLHALPRTSRDIGDDHYYYQPY
jgi:hypothetical protein